MHTTPIPISELRSLRRTTRRAREIAIAIASHPYTKRKALEQLIARGERALTWVGHTMTQRSYGGWNDCPRSLGDLIYQGWVRPEMIPSEPCRPLYVVRDAGKISKLRAQLAHLTRLPWDAPAVTSRVRKDVHAGRHTDADAKRARGQASFRRGYLRRLAARERAALRVAKTRAGILARVETRQSRIAELNEIARLRSIATGKPCAPTTLPSIGEQVREVARLLRIPSPEFARSLGCIIDMRGKDATLSARWGKSGGKHSSGVTEWKGGHPVSYTRATHDNYVRAWGVVAAGGRRLDCVVHTREFSLHAPDGWTWSVDAQGIRIMRTGSRDTDYHPDAQDVSRPDAVSYCVARAEELHRKRQLAKAQLVSELADTDGVLCCLSDSLRAGNCRSGSIAWAERHGIDITKHYEPVELLARANGDAGRVRLVISAARLRHAREMAQGFSALADHQA